MMMRRMAAVGVLVSLSLSMLPGAGGAAYGQEVVPLPTAEEVRKQVDAGEYREALKGLSRIVALKGQAAAGYDRVEMLTLRGECQLQLRETKTALDSLDAAYKEAMLANRDGWEPLALAALVQNSPQFKYTPKTKTGPLAPKVVDILDRKERPAAYKALFDDLLGAAKKKVEAAQSSRNMTPILEAAKTTAALRAVEKAGTGETKLSKEMAEDLSRQAVILLSGPMTEMGLRVESIRNYANTISIVSYTARDGRGREYVNTVRQRRGLSQDDRDVLKGVQLTCTQVIGAANELAGSLGAQVDTFREIAAKATGVGQRATAVLNTDYNSIPNN
jgi:hypothetical protein